MKIINDILVSVLAVSCLVLLLQAWIVVWAFHVVFFDINPYKTKFGRMMVKLVVFHIKSTFGGM